MLELHKCVFFLIFIFSNSEKSFIKCICEVNTEQKHLSLQYLASQQTNIKSVKICIRICGSHQCFPSRLKLQKIACMVITIQLYFSPRTQIITYATLKLSICQTLRIFTFASAGSEQMLLGFCMLHEDKLSQVIYPVSHFCVSKRRKPPDEGRSHMLKRALWVFVNKLSKKYFPPKGHLKKH